MYRTYPGALNQADRVPRVVRDTLITYRGQSCTDSDDHWPRWARPDGAATGGQVPDLRVTGHLRRRNLRWCHPRQRHVREQLLSQQTSIKRLSHIAHVGRGRSDAEHRSHPQQRVTTNPATAVTASDATLHGRVDPGGAVVNVSFQFGLTTECADTGRPHRACGNGAKRLPGGVRPTRRNDVPLPRQRPVRFRHLHRRRPDVHDPLPSLHSCGPGETTPGPRRCRVRKPGPQQTLARVVVRERAGGSPHCERTSPR